MKRWLGLTVLAAAMMCAMLIGASAEECTHYCWCTNLTKCWVCGATGLAEGTGEVIHNTNCVNLGEQHQYQCQNCDYVEEPAAHWGHCDAPTTCTHCDAENITIAPDNLFHDNAYVDLGTQHQYQCLTCGLVKYEASNHGANCDTPTTCRWCGLTGVDIPDNMIYHDTQLVNLGAQHQYQCTRCDYAGELFDHRADCDAPTTCLGCHGTDLTILPEKVEHIYQTVNIGASHQEQCSRCGGTGETEEHSVYCDAPNLCTVCGDDAVVVAENNWLHHGEWVNYGDYCLLECTLCPYAMGLGRHMIMCDTPNVCDFCGTTFDNVDPDVLWHTFKITNIGNQHQDICKNCGDALEPEDHYASCDDSTTCAWCGATDVQMDESAISHSMIIVNVGDQHQKQCENCDYKGDLFDHSADCHAPTTCRVCSASGVVIAEDQIDHVLLCVDLGDQHQEQCVRCDYMKEAAAHRYRCHTMVCADCGKEGSGVPEDELYHAYVLSNIGTHCELRCVDCDIFVLYEHEVYCTMPTECLYCGGTDLVIPEEKLRHAVLGADFDAEYHWGTCVGCDKEIKQLHTLDENNECTTVGCGYDGSVIRLPGDVNDDGAVNMRDALALLKKLADWDVTINEANADCNGDDAVNMRDALLLLKYLADWDVELK
ncbi:MAG: hypothetical protein IJ438_05320 [Clostridia bacterium]|nr:hypothetical protein [Clostridia bacterium]